MGDSFSVSIKGKTQGAFKAETTQGSAKNKIAGLSFSYEVKSPRDAATGNASGKRQHSPVRIVKAVGAASPQIFQALVNNEVLTEVTFEFTKTNAIGAGRTRDGKGAAVPLPGGVARRARAVERRGARRVPGAALPGDVDPCRGQRPADRRAQRRERRWEEQGPARCPLARI